MRYLLVTGGCGFIGSNLIRYLLSARDFNGEIVNVDKLTYAGNLENLEGVEKTFPGRYHFVAGDICDNALMADVFDRFTIDSVCHLAAESHVDRSIAGPKAFVRTNIVGTFVLLEQFRKYRDRMNHFHHVSTDEVFGSLGPEGFFREDTAYDPSSPYSASKAAADHLVRAYSRTYRIPVTISNCSNNYGPYQFPEKLIPLIIRNAVAGKTLPVYGDGLHVRDWLYVKDHCRAIWLIMKKGRKGATYNVGGRHEVRNIDIVKNVCDILDEIKPRADGLSHQQLIEYVADRPGHDRRYAIDCSRMETELGWRPKETFKTGLQKTLKWYIGNAGWVERAERREGEKMRKGGDAP